MRHFIIELTYNVTFDQLAEAIPLHREFLQRGYEQGWVLFSGPQLPKTGGVIVMRMESLDAVMAFFNQDPFKLRDLAQYRVVEFDMVKRQPVLDEWR